jgi:hypothetical protein
MDLLVAEHQEVEGGFPLELIQQCLWQIAASGGNVAKAHEALVEQGVTGPEGKPVSMSALRKWKKSTYKGGYHQILTEYAEKLDEILARQATENAIELGDAVDKALARTLSQLATANGVEASQILRNVAQARDVELRSRASLQGRDPASRIARTMEDAMAELKGMGVATIEREDDQTGVIQGEGRPHPLAREEVKRLTGQDADEFSRR